MAKIIIKQSVALFTSVLLLAGPLGSTASAAGTVPAPATLADLLNPAQPLIPASLSAALEAASPAQSLAAAAAPAVVDKNIDTASSDKISVIIQLSGQAVSEAKHSASQSRRSFSVQSAEQSVMSEQSAFKSTASSKGIAMKVNYQYNTVLNGMEVTVSANQIPKLAQLPGVKAISLNSTYYPIPLIESTAMETSTGQNIEIDPLAQIGADTAWQSGFTGKGVKVGVIDTGVDYKHPDLKNAYKGGYDSFYQDNDPYEEIPAIFGFEGTSHGTHVAGTIVGRGENPGSEVVQKGVAYEADLYAYKVLGATYNEESGLYKTSGTSAQVIDGIEHAVKDGMDVINLSLGSDLEKGPDSPDSIAVNNAVLSGVIAVVANGNAGADGKYYYSMGSPASSQLAISVAAATSTSIHYSANFSAQLKDTVTEEVYSVTDTVYSDLLGWSYNGANFGELLGTEPLDAVYAGLGDYSDYNEVGDVTGKVVVVSRGNLTFVDKVAIAKSYGAKALIIFNGNSLDGSETADLSVSIPGRDGPIGGAAYLGDDYAHIPTFDMEGSAGRALAREILANPDKPLQITFGKDFPMTTAAGDTIADFSSRGPNSDDNYGIKPDISAPGVNILSTLPEYAAYYGDPEYSYYFNGEPSYDLAYHRSSGTSMASPHIAGLAALMTQAHPDWTPLDIRAALANTADVISDENGTQYDVYSQGSGRADVASALITPAVVEALDTIIIYDEKMNATEIESEASNLSFGAVEPGSAPLSKPLRVKNLSGNEVTYTASIVMHPNVTSDPSDPIATPDVSSIEMTLGGLDTNSTITAAAGSSTPFTLSARAADDAAHGVYEGEILLQSPGLPPLHLPFVIHVGSDVADNDFGLTNGNLTNKRISPAAPADLSVTLANDNTNFMVVEVNGLSEGYIGRISDWYDLDAQTQTLSTLPEGRVKFENIDGSYSDGTVDEYGNYVIKHLEPGQYKLGIYAVQYDERFNVADVQLVNMTFYMVGEDEDTTGPTEPTPDPGNGGGATPAPTPAPTTAPDNGGGGGAAATTPAPTPSSSPAIPAEQLAAVVEPDQTVSSLTGNSAPDGDHNVITVTSTELQKVLDAATAPTVFSVTAATSANGSTKVSLKLTAGQVKLLQSAPAGSALAFTSNGASVSLPLSALSGLAADADVNITITPDTGSKAAFTAGYTGAAILGTPYTFEAVSTAAGVSSKITLAPDQIVHRAFLLDKGIDAANAGALYTEGSQVYPVPAKFKTLSDGSTLVTISRPGFSTYAAATRAITFTDIGSSWAKNQIQTLADKFILNGTSAGTFSPKNPVTRAQFASMLVTAIGLDRHTGTNGFSDIKGNEWYAQDVNAAYQAGLITGYDETFRPNDEITRQDLTVMLARAIKLLDIKFTSGTARVPYSDAAAFSSYAKDSIQAVSDAGLMQGEEQQGQFIFHPALPTTREAAAKVLYQLLTLAGSL